MNFLLAIISFIQHVTIYAFSFPGLTYTRLLHSSVSPIHQKPLGITLKVYKRSRKVCVTANCKLEYLQFRLLQYGLTLPTAPQEAPLTVGGAVSVGSHSSGYSKKSLAAYVTDIQYQYQNQYQYVQSSRVRHTPHKHNLRQSLVTYGQKGLIRNITIRCNRIDSTHNIHVKRCILVKKVASPQPMTFASALHKLFRDRNLHCITFNPYVYPYTHCTLVVETQHHTYKQPTRQLNTIIKLYCRASRFIFLFFYVNMIIDIIATRIPCVHRGLHAIPSVSVKNFIHSQRDIFAITPVTTPIYDLSASFSVESAPQFANALITLLQKHYTKHGHAITYKISCRTLGHDPLITNSLSYTGDSIVFDLVTSRTTPQPLLQKITAIFVEYGATFHKGKTDPERFWLASNGPTVHTTLHGE